MLRGVVPSFFVGLGEGKGSAFGELRDMGYIITLFSKSSGGGANIQSDSILENLFSRFKEEGSVADLVGMPKGYSVSP